jgi:hypothetical protein
MGPRFLSFQGMKIRKEYDFRTRNIESILGFSHSDISPGDFIYAARTNEASILKSKRFFR